MGRFPEAWLSELYHDAQRVVLPDSKEQKKFYGAHHLYEIVWMVKSANAGQQHCCCDQKEIDRPHLHDAVPRKVLSQALHEREALAAVYELGKQVRVHIRLFSRVPLAQQNRHEDTVEIPEADPDVKTSWGHTFFRWK
jgi:hypothetical protein